MLFLDLHAHAFRSQTFCLRLGPQIDFVVHCSHCPTRTIQTHEKMVPAGVKTQSSEPRRMQHAGVAFVHHNIDKTRVISLDWASPAQLVQPFFFVMPCKSSPQSFSFSPNKFDTPVVSFSGVKLILSLVHTQASPQTLFLQVHIDPAAPGLVEGLVPQSRSTEHDWHKPQRLLEGDEREIQNKLSLGY